MKKSNKPFWESVKNIDPGLVNAALQQLFQFYADSYVLNLETGRMERKSNEKK